MATYQNGYRWVPKRDKSTHASCTNSRWQYVDDNQWNQHKCDRQHKLIQKLLENYMSMVQKQENLHEQIQMLQSQVIHLSSCLSWAWNADLPTTTDEAKDWTELESETPPANHHRI